VAVADLVDGAAGDDPPLVHDDDAVTDGLDVV
jgi:hypothetical protein